MMCGAIPLAVSGGHKNAMLGAVLGGIPGALVGNSADRKKKLKQQQGGGVMGVDAPVSAPTYS
jgi:hypothetical protein